MSWYSKICQDIANIPAALDFFNDEIIQAKKECKLFGNIEKAAARLPGIVEVRFNQLQEVEAILEYLNIELRKTRSRLFRKYLETYQRALSSRDCEKYVDGEDEVIEFEKIINEVALIRNQYLGISKALDQQQWQISNIVKLRVVGMEDATL